MNRRRVWSLCMFTVVLAACREGPRPNAAPADDPWAGKPEPPAQDYVDARRSFRTKLLRKEASPQSWSPLTLRPDASEIEFESGGQKLKAWVSKAGATSVRRAPAVVFLHGGFAFAEDDWDMSAPFREAGFVVLTPILRGENGSSGSFTLFYDEVEDVLAATEALAKRSDVDTSRIFVTGHSAGGVLAMLAAMSSKRFRAMTSLSGVPDATAFANEPGLIPFDPDDANEFRMRSPLAFPTSFKCPGRLFWGEEEAWIAPSTRDLAQRAKAGGQDVQAIEVPGDHQSMAAPAIANSIEFFIHQQ